MPTVLTQSEFARLKATGNVPAGNITIVPDVFITPEAKTKEITVGFSETGQPIKREVFVGERLTQSQFERRKAAGTLPKDFIVTTQKGFIPTLDVPVEKRLRVEVTPAIPKVVAKEVPLRRLPEPPPRPEVITAEPFVMGRLTPAGEAAVIEQRAKVRAVTVQQEGSRVIAALRQTETSLRQLNPDAPITINGETTTAKEGLKTVQRSIRKTQEIKKKARRLEIIKKEAPSKTGFPSLEVKTQREILTREERPLGVIAEAREFKIESLTELTFIGLTKLAMALGAEETAAVSGAQFTAGLLVSPLESTVKGIIEIPTTTLRILQIGGIVPKEIEIKDIAPGFQPPSVFTPIFGGKGFAVTKEFAAGALAGELILLGLTTGTFTTKGAFEPPKEITISTKLIELEKTPLKRKGAFLLRSDVDIPGARFVRTQDVRAVIRATERGDLTIAAGAIQTLEKGKKPTELIAAGISKKISEGAALGVSEIFEKGKKLATGKVSSAFEIIDPRLRAARAKGFIEVDGRILRFDELISIFPRQLQEGFVGGVRLISDIDIQQTKAITDIAKIGILKGIQETAKLSLAQQAIFTGIAQIPKITKAVTEVRVDEEQVLFQPFGLIQELPKQEVIGLDLISGVSVQREITRRTVKEKELIKTTQFQIQLQQPTLKQITTQEVITTEFISPKQKLKVSPLSALDTAQKELTKQVQKQAKALKAPVTPRVEIVPITPSGLLPILPILPPLPKVKRKIKKEGYHALVRNDATRRSKFIQVNKQPLTKQQALGLGAQIVDQSVSRTFKIKKAKKAAVPRPELNRAWANLKRKFRKPIRKGKPIPAARFIEKSRHAIDSRGELQGITAKGLLARRRRRF